MSQQPYYDMYHQ